MRKRFFLYVTSNLSLSLYCHEVMKNWRISCCYFILQGISFPRLPLDSQYLSPWLVTQLPLIKALISFKAEFSKNEEREKRKFRKLNSSKQLASIGSSLQRYLLKYVIYNTVLTHLLDIRIFYVYIIVNYTWHTPITLDNSKDPWRDREFNPLAYMLIAHRSYIKLKILLPEREKTNSVEFHYTNQKTQRSPIPPFSLSLTVSHEIREIIYIRICWNTSRDHT